MGRNRKLTADARLMATMHGLGKIHATQEEAAAVLGVTRPTLWQFLKDFPEVAEYFEAGKDAGKAELRRLQWASAKKGNTTMLIWLGKQLLKQRDDAAMAEAGTRESIEQLREAMERKFARLTETEPKAEMASEPNA